VQCQRNQEITLQKTKADPKAPSPLKKGVLRAVTLHQAERTTAKTRCSSTPLSKEPRNTPEEGRSSKKSKKKAEVENGSIGGGKIYLSMAPNVNPERQTSTRKSAQGSVFGNK